MHSRETTPRVGPPLPPTNTPVSDKSSLICGKPPNYSSNGRNAPKNGELSKKCHPKIQNFLPAAGIANYIPISPLLFISYTVKSIAWNGSLSKI